MATLFGYLNYPLSHTVQAVFGDVFSPSGQTTGGGVQTSDTAYLFSIPKINRVPETLKLKEIERYLEGQYSGGVAGEHIGRYSDDFYHRIHLTPTILRLGNLISTQSRNIEVWNAFFHSVELDSVQLLNGDGLTVTPPVGTPYTMAALESLTYEVSISSDGPPSIYATIRWTVDDQVLTEDHDALITGDRVVPFPLAPDWANSLNETLEWKTSVLKSYNSEEQRSRIRKRPRRGQSYPYTLVFDDASSVENLLWGWHSRLFAVPHWTDTTLHPVDLLLGQTTVVTETDGYAYSAGGLFFVTDGKIFEMQEILSVEPGVVHLKKGLDSLWGRPSVIGPANMARIDGDFSVNMQRDSANVMSTTIDFMHEPVQTDPNIPDAVYTDTYLGEEIFLKEPNWKGGLKTAFESEAKVLDFGLQGFATSPRGKSEVVTEYEWLLNGRSQMVEFREFLGRRKGRLTGFWMPSWKHDFTLRATASSGELGFVVTENYYAALISGDPGRNHVRVLFKDGTSILREITNAAQNPDDTMNLITSETNGVSFSVEDVRIISLVGWSRMYSDKFTLKYHDRDVAIVNSSIVNILL